MHRCALALILGLGLGLVLPACLISPNADLLDDATPDTARPDGPRPDAPRPDAAPPDTQAPDAQAPDTATPDSPAPDAPVPDAPVPDAPVPDAAPPDLPPPDLPPPDLAPPPLGQGNARVHYGELGQKVRARAWTSSSDSWSAVTTPLTAAEPVLWVQGEVSPVVPGAEVITAFSAKTGATTLAVLERAGAGWAASWSAKGSTSTHADKRGFDVAYEQQSGDLLVVYTGNQITPRYRTKTKAGWSAEQALPLNDGIGPNPDPNSGTVLWVELEPEPGSNKIALGYVDDNHDLVALVWDGTQWDTSTVSTLATNVKQNPNTKVVHQRGFDLAWETLSGNLVAAWGVHNVDVFDSAVLTKITGKWVGLATVGIVNGEVEYVDLSSSPTNNLVAGVFMDQGGGTERLGLAMWNGTTWINAVEADSQTRDVNDLAFGDAPAAVAWAGTTGTAVCVYADNVVARLDWAKWTSATGWVLGPDLTITGKGETESVVLASVPGTSKLLALLGDSSGKLWSAVYDGTSWSTSNKGAALSSTLATSSAVPFSAAFQVK